MIHNIFLVIQFFAINQKKLKYFLPQSKKHIAIKTYLKSLTTYKSQQATYLNPVTNH